MNNFSWTEFTKRTVIKSDIQSVYNAWAVPIEIEAWFLSKADYFDSDDKNQPKDQEVESGCRYEWNWFLYEETEHGRVISANGKDEFVFSFAKDCEVRIVLKEKGDHVLVTLTQSNIPTDEESKGRIRVGCDGGWTFYLANLKSYLETGHDLRLKKDYFGVPPDC